MKYKKIAAVVGTFALLQSALCAAVSTMNSTDHYAWSANTGWIDFRAERPNAGDGFRFGENACAGFLWSPNLGWIDCGDGTPANGSTYGNNNNNDYGVNHYGGDLSGMAWSANTGWINFGWATSTNEYRPRVDLITGEFSGYAWSANCGWINLGTSLLKTDTMAITDTDGDGIADSFELNYAGDLETMTSISDTDGDGISDKNEYIVLSNPIGGNPPFRITRTAKVPNQNYVEVEWPSSPARVYGLEYRTNLVTGSWIFALDIPGAANTNLTTVPVNGTLPQVYMRLEAKLPLQP